jgi:hypothetical protein
LVVSGGSYAGGFIQSNNYLSPFNGFRNAIINGDFRINQRNFTSLTSGAYFFDRWTFGNNTGTVTVTPQTFTVGSPAATGYESSNFARQVTSGQSGTAALAYIAQHIEDVRTFANSTITVSFWAKAASGTPKIAVELIQNFGSGGSPSSAVFTYGGQATLSTSWTRYSVSVSVPNISGKTIGTTANTSSLQVQLWTSAGTDFNSRTGSLGVQNNTFDFWGVQVERGSNATPFEQRPIGTELALCQRYYEKSYAIGTAPGTNGFTGAYLTMGTTDGANNAQQIVTFRTPKRYTAYTITTYNGFGTSGYTEYYRNGGSSSTATPTLDAYTECSFRGYTSTGASYAAVQFYFHWVCNAEF